VTLLLTNEEVDRLLDMRECLDLFESAYRELGEGIGVTRTASQVFAPTQYGADAVYSLKSMDGAAPFLDVAAVRLTSEILTWPADADGHARKIRIATAPNGRFVGLVLLFSTLTSEPLAILPDGVIQRMRVGAGSALAAKYLARADAREVAMLGSGWQAAAQVRAITLVRNVARVRCFSPNAVRCEAFAQEMTRETGVNVTACASPEVAVKGADIVLCATNSAAPVFFAAWIEKGMHLGAIQHAELDPQAFTAADVRIVHYSGRPAVTDASRGIDRGEMAESVRRAARAAIGEAPPSLHDLVLGRARGRTSPNEVTAFLNNVGLGYQFAVLGARVYRNARAKGIGRELPTDWFTEDVNP
jgi:ornithine cyclodeaminase/alanine dehydrogenase-like protein (mu-crystallin family)